jgi:TldD protein
MYSRRSFLHSSLAGTAVVSMPGFFAACAGAHSAAAPAPVALAAAPVPPNPFYAWFGVDDAVLRSVMSELVRNGADSAELYFQYSRANALTLEDGIVSSASTTIDQGVGLRAVVGDQTGYAFTEDLSPDAMKGAARVAAAIAKSGAATLPVAFTTASAPARYTLAVPWADVGLPDRLAKMEKLAALAKAADPAVEKVVVTWADEEQRVLVADLQGNVQVDTRPMSRVWCQVTARKNGVTQSNSSNLAGRRGMDWYDDANLQLVAKQAVDRTMILFEAKRPPAGEMPVVLAAGASGILLHEAVGHGMEADFNRKNISIYADMIGRKVAPDFVTIVDDGTCANERGALNFDDEGTVAERTVLVDKGVLATYLHDSISAKHYGVKSTGSGRRESFRHAPLPRMRCTYMENGPHDHDEIVASVKNGIIAETFTNGQVQIGAGDYTFYIKNGWLIENGKITAPIKDCNIIGNGPEALRNVTMAANDGKLDTGGWTCGKDGQSVPVSQGLPTVLVSKMTVGGVNG